MTVSESRRELTERFRSSGVESPEVNAEWLLASLLNCSRTELPLRLDESIPDPQLEQLNSQAARRAKREGRASPTEGQKVRCPTNASQFRVGSANPAHSFIKMAMFIHQLLNDSFMPRGVQ